MGAELPTGTLTFLFTDLEGSTRLWEQHPEAMQAALARHDEVVRRAIEAHGGSLVKTTGDGAHAAFGTAHAGIAAAIDAQRALARETWGATGPLRVRMGLHTGAAEQRAGDYFGKALNRAARLTSIAHGGQVVVSQATADLARDALTGDCELIDLGEHRLRDLSRAERVYQVAAKGLERDFARLRSLDAFPGNLPIARTPLIGRSQELALLATLLDAHRLVTLTGVGGVGKTRLAMQLAASVLDRFPDGAWWVPLESIQDPAFVPRVVAAALGIDERPGRPATERVRDAIGPRELLLVLDNCEHLLDACAPLVDELLDACTGLRVVATSREPLGVEGEQTWPTPSLELPDREAGLDELAGSDAVAVFVERAQEALPDFELLPANAAAVAALCARLDGIPLAIELAAARISSLSPQEILERIDQRFVLLTGGRRTALERHQTLQAAVDWSYELLDDDERRLFERLSVFAGGFTLDAACAVTADEGTGELEVLDLLDGLVAKSMVVAERSAASVRYRLLDTLRAYADDHLDPGVEATTRTRHARYYLEFAEALLPSLFGPDQLVAWDRVDAELDNLHTALEWMLETGDRVGALRLATTPLRGWGYVAELLPLREAALDAVATLPPAERVRPLAYTANAAHAAGEDARASELAGAVLACARDANIDPHPLAFQVLGLVALTRGEPARAVEMLEQAVAEARRADDGSPMAHMGTSSSLSDLCSVLVQTGEPERAIAAGEEALSVAREIGMPSLLARVLFELALAYQRSDPQRAARLVDESLERTIGARSSQRGQTLVAAGEVHGTLGDHDRAFGAYAEALTLARQSGERDFVPLTLQGIARALRHLNRMDEAALLLGASDHLAPKLRTAGRPAADAARARAITRLRDILGAERFDAAFQAGTALSFDAALTTAIDIATAAQPAAQPSPPAPPIGQNEARTRQRHT